MTDQPEIDVTNSDNTSLPLFILWLAIPLYINVIGIFFYLGQIVYFILNGVSIASFRPLLSSNSLQAFLNRTSTSSSVMSDRLTEFLKVMKTAPIPTTSITELADSDENDIDQVITIMQQDNPAIDNPAVDNPAIDNPIQPTFDSFMETFPKMFDRFQQMNASSSNIDISQLFQKLTDVSLNNPENKKTE